MRGRGRIVLLIHALATATPLCGQTVRATGITSARFVSLRELVPDSVDVATTSGSGLLRRAPDGTIVRCVTGETFCRYLRSGSTLSTVPLVQDITLSAWGFGQGIRAFAQLRGRAGVGRDPELWPRADDPFDLLVAYVELDRSRVRLRAGRQWKVSGLGYYNWDGASVLVRAVPTLHVEAYGGWSLARGLNQPVTGEALEAIEPFAPDERALLLGAQITWRPARLASLAALYQREIRADRYGLYSERVALDGSIRSGRFHVDGAFEMDVALRDVNDARVRAGAGFGGDLTAELFARYYRPYFDLWTIWGAFDPVGFTEVGVGTAWRPAGMPFSLSADVARRGYPDTGAATTFGDPRDTGWRFGASASFEPGAAWQASLSYHTGAGFGAGQNDLSAFLRRSLPRDAWLGAHALLFQRAYEFRVGDGSVLGLGLDAGAAVATRIRAQASAGLYRHLHGGGDTSVDWNQTRASLLFEWVVGPEPGLPRIAGGAR